MESNTLVDNTCDASTLFLSKIKELLIITKDRLKKNPQHPLHLQLRKEFFDLHMEIEFNGVSVDGCKYLFKMFVN